MRFTRYFLPDTCRRSRHRGGNRTDMKGCLGMSGATSKDRLMRISSFLLQTLFLLQFSSLAAAALYDRGGGLIYDDSTNLTWLADSLAGRGSVFDDGYSSTDGLMTWASASAWAAQFEYSDPARGYVFDDWRLPAVVDIDSLGCTPGYSSSPFVTPDCGYVSNPSTSELATLFYVSLGNPPRFVPKTGPFGSLPGGLAWLGSQYTVPEYLLNASSILTVGGWLVREPGMLEWPALSWAFGMSEGFQGPGYAPDVGVAWAVRTGDVTAVPVPGTIYLMLSGLLVFAIVANKTKQNG